MPLPVHDTTAAVSMDNHYTTLGVKQTVSERNETSGDGGCCDAEVAEAYLRVAVADA